MLFLQFSAAKISSLLLSFSWNVFILNESRLSCWKRQFLRGSWSFQPSGYIQKQTFWSVKSKHSLTDGSFDLLFASGTHQLHNGLKQFFEGVLGASTFEVIEAEGCQLRASFCVLKRKSWELSHVIFLKLRKK